jgi:hypothetical protein
MNRSRTAVGANAGAWLVVALGVALSGCGQAGTAATVALTASAPTNIASAVPTAAAGSSPTSSAQPLPDTWLGAWAHASSAFMWFIRSRDPACTTLARTDLDCAVWQPTGKPNEVAVASMNDGQLSLAWVNGYCTRVTSTYTVALNGDSMVLTEQPGGCSGGNLTLTRAGTGSAPTAPPRPLP